MSGADQTGGLGPFLPGCFPPPQGGLGGQPLAQYWGGASRDGGEGVVRQQETSGRVGSRAQGAHRGRCPLGCVRPHGEASRNCGPQSQHLGFCPYPVPSAPLQPFTPLVPVCHSRVVPCQLANPRVRDGESQSEWPSAGL